MAAKWDAWLRPSKSADDSNIYVPLYASRKEIRILHLFKKSRSRDDLRCTLDNISLLDENRPQYQAISYCWGNRKDLEPMLINGKRVDVPASAKKALERFAPTHGSVSVTLWIDAICINQADTAERNQQIKLMGDVYRHSSQTLIWLGHPGGPLFDLGTAVSAAVSHLSADTPKWFEVWRSPSTVEARHVSTPDKFFNRPWFQRLWVLQEAVLAPEAKCHLGDHEFSWQDICECARRIHGARPERTKRTAFTQNRIGYQTALLAGGFSKSKTLPLEQLLSINKHLECIDPKDKVFAILGLVKCELSGSWNAELLVDYDKPLPEIYASATRAALLEARGLALLGEVEHIHSDRLAFADMESEARFPSWVPRYDREPTSAVNAAPFPMLDAASEDSTRIDLVLLGSNRYSWFVLPLRGKVVDRVTCVGERIRYSHASGKPGSFLGRMVALIRQNGLQTQSDLKSLVLLITALSWSPMLGTTLTSAAKHKELLKYLDIAVQEIVKGSNPDKAVAILGTRQHAQEFALRLRSVITMCINRRLFITALGNLGLGPQTMTADNSEIVVILHGSKLPCILRSRGNVPSSSSGYGPLMALQYRFVGQCYIHGSERSFAAKEIQEEKVFEIV